MPVAVHSVARGPPESLVIAEVPPARPGKGEVVVRVHTCSVAFPDTLLIEDRYQHRPARPFSPGGEVAGVVSAVGAGVAQLRAGQRVRAGMALGYGAWREEVVVPAALVWPIADDVPFEGAFLGNHVTAYYALAVRGELRKGETVLVLGAAGGLGLPAVELAKALGATVIAAAAGDAKLRTCRQYGADHCIDYSAGDLRKAVQAATKGAGVDVVFDPVGGRWADAAARGLKWGGRYLVLGFASGEIPKLPLNLLLMRGADARGVMHSTWLIKHPEKDAAARAEVGRLVASGQCRPLVSKVYPLRDAGQALRDLSARRVHGRVVLATDAHAAAAKL